MSGATANAIYAKVSELQNGLIELRAMLADLEITDSTLPGQEQRPRTGWRWRRGETGASGAYVRDPSGTDTPPPGYSANV